MLKIAHLGKALNVRVGAARPLSSNRQVRTRTFAMKAVFEGVTVAESDATVIVENNHYFPPSSLKKEHFKDSALHSTCGWKGTCNYYDVVVGDKVAKDAAWYYPTTKEKAKNIEGYVAFWKGVRVVA